MTGYFKGFVRGVGLLFMVMVMPISGPLAGIFTYQLVVGAVEPSSEILRFTAISWVAYLFCVWIMIMVNDDVFPKTDRFVDFFKVAIGFLGITVGGLGTLMFAILIVFPGSGPGNGSEISHESIRDGLLAIAFLALGVLLFRSFSQSSQVSTPRFSHYEQYPENWAEIRQEVLSRDEYRCANCQSGRNLHVHHIVPLSLGGSNELSNLKTLCKDCHKKLHPHMRD